MGLSFEWDESNAINCRKATSTERKRYEEGIR
jgi:uncharacterized DUF497 family protein